MTTQAATPTAPKTEHRPVRRPSPFTDEELAALSAAYAPQLARLVATVAHYRNSAEAGLVVEVRNRAGLVVGGV